MKWKSVNPDGENPTPRHGHRAVEFEEGIIIYGGGNRGICNQVNIYNVYRNKNILPMFEGRGACPGVAAFGMVKRHDKIIVFGGMLEYQVYTNDLYTLEINDWHWTKVTNAIGEPPRARIGHSFTAVDENRVYMFGGIINVSKHPRKTLSPRYTNDLFILHTYTKNKFAWEELVIPNGPRGRESHSAVFYHNKNLNQKNLIIFGGMNGSRLNDLWFLNVDDLIWQQFDVLGIPPEPRSLHTASLIGSRMFIFGGWIKDPSFVEESEDDGLNYISTNSLSLLDLDSMEWNSFELGDHYPPPRAGHCAVATYNRIYIFSGRSTYRYKKNEALPCLDDFWFLEISSPSIVENIKMTKCTAKSMAIEWNRVPNANCFLVEVRRVHEIKSIKLVSNFAQTSIMEKRRLDGSTGKKVVIIKPLKISQFDGCDDELEDIEMEQNKDEKVPCRLIESSDANAWCTVGIFKNNNCNVDGYFSFTFPPDFCDDVVPEKIQKAKIELNSNTMYAFRIAGVNSCGIGQFSKMSVFRTFAEGWPTKPSNFKLIDMPKALRLVWTLHPAEEKITEYMVFIKTMVDDKLSFNRIYVGKQPTCTVPYELLKNPSYQLASNANPSCKCFIFRVCAVNEKGIGPYLEVTRNIENDFFKP